MDYILENDVHCPNCGCNHFTGIREFNLMFETFQGVVKNERDVLYLRPETAQGIFVNFANVQRSARMKLPFGIGQIGKSFRNEITPGNFVFRTREFEQMELEFFCKPGEDEKWFMYWIDFCKKFFTDLGLNEYELRLREHDVADLAHYSKSTTDIEFKFPFGWDELCGIANRVDFDLKKHQEHSKKSLSYFDEKTNNSYVPYCIEPSLGVDRALLSFLCSAYTEEMLDDESKRRVVLKLHPALAPVKACVLPLSRKLSDKAFKVYKNLAKNFVVEYDDKGSIGRRYRRQDEIGTPFCLTYDFETDVDGCMTLRERDNMKQKRISIEKLASYILSKIYF